MDVTGESLGGRGNGGEVCPILCGHVERLSMLLVCGVCVVYFLRDYDREKHTPLPSYRFLTILSQKRNQPTFFFVKLPWEFNLFELAFYFFHGLLPFAK